MNEVMKKDDYYAVRCLFSHPTRERIKNQNLYEERITIWEAQTWEEAYKMAELEAKNYAKEADAIFIEATDSFKLFDNKFNSGLEVWSTMRDSKVSNAEYISNYINTGKERDHEI